MSQEISRPEPGPEPDVTEDRPAKRGLFQRRGFRLSTPVGEIAFAIRTPAARPVVPKRYDPLGLTDRAIDMAKTGIKLAAWSEEQLVTLLRNRLDALDTAPAAMRTAEPDDTDAESLSTKMGRLLERALDQSTQGSQVELYHRLLNQLVADEARIIGALSEGAASPLVNIYSRTRTSGQPLLENACLIGRTANVALPKMVPQYVSHLLSLGLVETGPEDPAKKADYEVLLAEPMVLAAIKRGTRGPLGPRTEKLTLTLSTLGMGLWQAAMQDGR
jgi:hypothetical protein